MKTLVLAVALLIVTPTVAATDVELIDMWGKMNKVCLNDKSDVWEAKEACTLRDNIDAVLTEKGYCNVEGPGWMNCEEAEGRLPGTRIIPFSQI
jgi:hypothetical protein